MDMKVDASVIRTERARRAWSQEHLAEVSCLSLRTIHRIEAAGAASNESVKALAAVLEIPITRLRTEDSAPSEPAAQGANHRWRRFGVAASILASTLAASIFLVRSVAAEQVMLDIDLTRNGENQVRSNLVVDTGKDAQIHLKDTMKFIIVPEVRPDGQVFLATQIFEFDGKDYVLAAHPGVLAQDKQQAEIHVSTDRGTTFRFVITPHIVRGGAPNSG
jgi:transcriptional regulator with XRE-family HTH domain